MKKKVRIKEKREKKWAINELLVLGAFERAFMWSFQSWFFSRKVKLSKTGKLKTNYQLNLKKKIAFFEKCLGFIIYANWEDSL